MQGLGHEYIQNAIKVNHRRRKWSVRYVKHIQPLSTITETPEQQQSLMGYDTFRESLDAWEHRTSVLNVSAALAIARLFHCTFKERPCLPGAAGWSCSSAAQLQASAHFFDCIQHNDTLAYLTLIYRAIWKHERAYTSEPDLTWCVTGHSSHLVPSAMQSPAVQRRLHYFVRVCLNKDAESVCVAMLYLCPDFQTSSRASQMDMLHWILCMVYLHRRVCGRCKLTLISTGGLGNYGNYAGLCDGDTHRAWLQCLSVQYKQWHNVHKHIVLPTEASAVFFL